MQHSIVARHVAWRARYVHPGLRARERRLGLHAGPFFTAAPSHRTVLHRPESGPLAALRAPSRIVIPAAGRQRAVGLAGSGSGMAWTSSDRAGGPRRSSLAPAWRA